MSDKLDMDTTAFSAPILVAERGGFRRTNEPVTVGIPLPEAAVFNSSELRLLGPDQTPCSSQIQVLARWFDGSIKWALVDFQADVAPGQVAEYLLRRVGIPTTVAEPSGIVVTETRDSIQFDTGAAVFVVDTRVLRPFSHVIANEIQVLDGSMTAICLVDENGQEYQPQITAFAVETRGILRSTLKVEGKLCAANGASFADFVSRLSFFSGSSTVEIKFTLWNSRSASHPGGLWDLGDEGSVYFKGLSIDLALNGPRMGSVLCAETSDKEPLRSGSQHFEIYQDSSGGSGWNSSNHIDRFGKVGSTFRGYRVTADGETVAEGMRASPTVSICGQAARLSGAIEKFWQNFPKAIEVEDRLLRLGLFPRQFGAPYELQAGEQKTHTVYLSFSGAAGFERVHHKLMVRSTLDWYAEGQALPYLSPRGRSSKGLATFESLDKLVDTAITGANTFFNRREIIDEYGWRNFGDLYADHEAVGNTGDMPLVAHYNNQYDVIHGALVQFLRSGDDRWFQLGDELARHVVDIDIYHTSADRIAFNGGLFWHTQHYTDAATCSHRAYSKRSVGNKGGHQSGGGPSGEHNYTTGLMEYYFLTGDQVAKETVLGLGDWVMNMDARTGGLIGAIDPRPRGLCSMTVSWNYHGPGRGCGNSINALLDAYVLSRDDKYWFKAEELIRRSIHPYDDIESRNLRDIEHRWSYTVFLQILGKYLDLKVERRQLDSMYAYARASLLHYARWMLAHEVPYLSVLDQVEIPTETWPAQDIRKSNVFMFAAKYSDEATRKDFVARSQFFFERCVGDLLQFQTCTLTRPVVLMLTNGYMHSYCANNPLEAAPAPDEAYEFAAPRTFKPQFYELYKLREHVHKAKGLLTDTVRRIRGRLLREQTGIVSERA